MKKKLLALLLAVTMIVSMLPGSVFAVTSYSSDTVLWTNIYTAGSHSIILTATAPAGYGFPDDVATVGKYYDGMTLRVTPVEDAEFDYGKTWTLDHWFAYKYNSGSFYDIPASGMAATAGDYFHVQYYNGSDYENVLIDGSCWVSGGTLGIPTATTVPARTLELSTADVAAADGVAADVTVKVTTNVKTKNADDVTVKLNGVTKYVDLTNSYNAFVTFTDVPVGSYTVTASAAAVSTAGADSYTGTVTALEAAVNVTGSKLTGMDFTVKKGGTALTTGALVAEDTTLTLQADVRYDANGDNTVTDADAVVTDGLVTYYLDGQALATVSAGDGYTFTTPAYTADDLVLKAKYWGSTRYNSVSSADFKLDPTSVTLAKGTASFAPALTIDTETTLALTGAVVDTAGTALTEDTDYTVSYYENKGDGIWVLEADGKVTPAAGYTYKAVVAPMGTYTKGGFELGPVGGAGIAASDTTVTINATVPTNVWQGKTAVDYTAEVKSTAAGTPAAVGGTVSFYLAKDSVTTFYETVSLVNGEATCSVVFPEAGDYTVKAVYSGTAAYNTSNLTTTTPVTVKSTTIDATADVTVGGGAFTLGADNTLTLTPTPDTYTEGTDYIVVWQQNDGSGWTEFARGGLTQTVKPMTNKWSYRAVLLPTGNYIAPANGIVSTIVSTSGAALLATTTELTVDNAAPFEDGTITLTAQAKHNTDVLTSGNVLFTLPDATLRTIPVDATGVAQITVKAPAYTDGTKTVKAQYLGDGVLYGASPAADTKTVTSKSVTIKATGDDYKIYNHTDAAYTTVAGVAETLKIKTITTPDSMSLTYGKDYLVEWFVCEDGATWISMGAGETVNVNPASNTWRYKAIVTPVGNYKEPYGGLTFLNTQGVLAGTTTTLVKTSPTDVYVGNTVVLTATVKESASPYNVVTSGKVYFYDYVTGMQLAVRNLDGTGTAVYSYTASGESLQVYAEFAGTGTHSASTSADLTVTPAAPAIKTAGGSLAFDVKDSASATLADHTKMVVGTEYTLTLPEIQDNATGAALVLNKNYTVQWKSRNADGSWSNIGGSTNAITVTPGHDKAAYTAIISPKYDVVLGSYYVLPVDGISMETVSTGVKMDSTVAVTIDGGATTAFEGTTVRVVATVKDTAANLINGGSVKFYVKGVALSPEVNVVDGVAAFDYVMPAYSDTAAENDYVFTAEYSGTNAYKAASDTTGKTVTDKSATLTLKAGANEITIKTMADGAVSGNPVVGTPYKLTAPAVYAKDDLVSALTLGTDYTLEWQYAENGIEWATITGTDATVTGVKFGNNKSAYRVIIRPAAGADYTMPSNIVVLYAPSVSTATTTTTLTMDKTEYFEGTQAVLTATVKKSSTEFATGTVEFYKGSSIATSNLVGYADLSSKGEAKLTITVPNFREGTPVNYIAVYTGNSVYKSSQNTKAMTIKSTEIIVGSYAGSWAYSKDLIVNPAAAPLTVGNTYTLTIPNVARFATTSPLLTIGKDYTVTWQYSNNGGAEWINMDNMNATGITVTPADKNIKYRAVITPTGDYKKVWSALDSATIDYLTMNTLDCGVVDTVTELTITDTAGKFGTETFNSEYEGETVTLTAKATYWNGTMSGGSKVYVPVKSGYFYFYNNGVQLNAVGVAVDAAGVAQYTDAVMTTWTSGHTQDTFKAVFVANDSYATSEKSDTVGIRSTVIDVPVVTSSKSGKLGGSAATATTKTQPLTDLPTGEAMTFTAGTVKAIDGRTLTAGVDFTYSWEKQDGGYMVAIPGAEANTYVVPAPYGVDGDSWRLVLAPKGHILTGSASQYLTVGTKQDPTVTLKVTEPYKANASHFGDSVTLTAEVTKTSYPLPTGYVEFWYKNGTDADVLLGAVDLVKKTGTTAIATASLTTTNLPHNIASAVADQLNIYVKYFGDSKYNAADSAKTVYQVWSTEVDASTLTVTSTPAAATLTAAKTYTLTLADTVKTADSEALAFADGKYVIEWQQTTDNWVTWEKVPSTTNSLTAVVKPATSNVQYRAQVTTTYKFLAEPYNTTPTRYDTKVSNVIGATVQNVTVVLTTNKDAAAPQIGTVYDGNPITIYAEIVPQTGYTVDPAGTVQFYYKVAAGAEIPVQSTDVMGSNNASVQKYLEPGTGVAHFYAAIETETLPAQANGKQQAVTVIAKYLGNETYNAGTKSDDVQVYSSTLYVDKANVANKVIGDPVGSTDGIIIYAPENVLKADGAPTVLTLKPLYTNDKENAAGTGIDAAVGTYADLTKDVNYTIQWQVSNDNGINWADISGQNNAAVTVTPLPNCAYRAVITAKTTAERTVKSETTYYSNVLKSESADAVLQMRVTPASSAAYRDDEILIDAYVSGGTTVPTGNVTLTITGGTTPVTCTLATVNGHVVFGTGATSANPVIKLDPGIYTVSATYTGNNGYVTEAAAQQFIVRYKADEVKVSVDAADYAGLTYGDADLRPDVAVVTFNNGAGFAQAQALADASVVFQYEMKVGDDWKPVDEPHDAGTYRVYAYLPQSIYYAAPAKTEPVEFTVAQKTLTITNILVQSKVYDGTTDANLLDAELTGIVAGDSVYAVGTVKTAAAEALVANSVTFTATGLEGADKDNYVLAGTTYTEDGTAGKDPFTIQRNQIVVNSASVADMVLTGLNVWDAYGTELIKGTGYTVRFFLHDGTGVKETTSFQKSSKYTVIVAPADTENYKGGASFVMKLDADGHATFEGTASEKQPGIVSITDTQLPYAAGVKATVTVSNGAAVTETYNAAADKAGRYGLTVTDNDAAKNVSTANGILTVYKVEATHVVPVVADKVYDGVAAANTATFPAGTYFSYTGGEIIGITYDAPKDVGEYTITAHVPATDTTVAYTETSTFKITQAEITVSAVALEKQVYRTNPELRVTYTGLMAGDSALNSFIAMPSFETPNTNAGNIDYNSVGEFVYVPYGVNSRNYKVVAYGSNTFSVKAEDPETTMQIVGVPAGNNGSALVYYGDNFRLSVYGDHAKRVNDDTLFTNPSSYLLWYIKEEGEGVWHAAGSATASGYVIDVDGNVKTSDATAAKHIYVKVTRGTGDYKIYAETDFVVNKKIVTISMIGTDTKVYNGVAQNLDLTKYSVVGEVHAGDVVLSLANFTPNSATNVGEYIIAASYTDAKYVGAGTGLMTITPKAAVVTTGTPATVTYGTQMVSAVPAYTDTAIGTDVLLTAPVTKSDVRANSDVGDDYEWFTAGVVNPNYTVTYKSAFGAITAKALTNAKAGVDGAVINTVTDQVKREYGVVNPVMGYQFNGFIAGDSLADMVIASDFVVYNRKQEDNANLRGSDKVMNALGTDFVNGYAAGDGYGKIDLADSLANINANALNYTFTPVDGRLDIYQKNITVTPYDLSALTGDEVKQENFSAQVVEVLTEAPMNDTIADLKLVFAPVGVAGTDFVGNQVITVALTAGSASLTAPDYFAQNYYRTDAATANLFVDGKLAKTAISATTTSLSVDTKHDVKYLPVYKWVDSTTEGTVGVIDAAELTATAWYVLNDANVWDADTKNNPVAVDDAGSFKTLYKFFDGSSNEKLAASAVITGATDANYFVKKDDTATKTNAEAVNVGNYGYVVLDKNGVLIAEGTMTADPSKPGVYTDTLKKAGNPVTLAYGTPYTVVLDLLTTDSFNLNKNTANITLSVPYTPTPSKPVLETKDHFAYIAGYPDGKFLPDGTITRAEAATIFYRLLVDKTYVGTKDFTDVEEDFWAYDAIQALAYNKVIVGYPDGSFIPNGKITRAEFCAIASRFFDMKAGTLTFTDVPETHWARNYIASAAKYGWIEDGATEFRPDDNITRADAIVIVNNMLGRKADKTFVSDNLTAVFSDVDATNPAFYAIMEAAVGHVYTKDSEGVETWTKTK